MLFTAFLLQLIAIVVQAADLLGCEPMLKTIPQHLRNVLLDVVKQSKQAGDHLQSNTSDRIPSLTEQQESTLFWNQLQVCSIVLTLCSGGVCQKLNYSPK